MTRFTFRNAPSACFLFSGLLAAVSPLAAQPSNRLCKSVSDIAALAGPTLTCRETRYGLAVGPVSEIVEAVASIDIAAAHFARYFDVPRAPIAIIFGGKVDGGVQASLTAKGFAVMPWVSSTDRAALVKEAIRTQVLRQTAGMSPAEQEAIVARALSQSASRLANQAQGVPREGALSHEIAHAWFIRLYDRDRAANAPHTPRYGSSSPDWLDETAAILAEDDIMTERRRSGIALAFSPEGTNRFWPLDRYLTMDHPLHSATRAMATMDAKTGGATARVFTGEQAAAMLATQGATPRPDWFYVQARLFADYLLTTSGNPRIVADIAEGLRGGATMASWLATDGARNRLPTNLTKLQAGWDAWLRAEAAKRVKPV